MPGCNSRLSRLSRLITTFFNTYLQNLEVDTIVERLLNLLDKYLVGTKILSIILIEIKN